MLEDKGRDYPEKEDGKENMDVLRQEFIANVINPVFNKVLGGILQKGAGELFDVFFERGSNGHCGEKLPAKLSAKGGQLLEQVYFYTIKKLFDRFQTSEELKNLMDNNAAMGVLGILIEEYFSKLVVKELNTDKAGYDRIMEGYISHSSASSLLDRTVTEIIRKTAETGKPTCLIFFDLDNFKTVNDYSHGVGDMVLAHMGKIVKEHSRGKPICIRWGGEEIVLVVDCGIDEACQAAYRLNESLIAHPCRVITTINCDSVAKISEERFQELAAGNEVKQGRGKEIIIPDRRSSSGEQVRLLEIPLSASIGVVQLEPVMWMNREGMNKILHGETGIKDFAEDEVSSATAAMNDFKMAVARANSLEMKAKQNGRCQAWRFNEDGNPEKIIKVPTVIPRDSSKIPRY